MPRRFPVLRPRKRPSRDVILEARGKRGLRTTLYLASLLWPVAVALWLLSQPGWAPGWGGRDAAAEILRKAFLLVPGIAAGLAAGRKAWPHYLPVLFLGAVPIVFSAAFLTVPLTVAAVLAVGFLYHWERCSRSGESVFAPPARDADAPRPSAGAASSGGGPAWKRKATVGNASGTGSELKRRPL